jgi:signal transduction histidine kinase
MSVTQLDGGNLLYIEPPSASETAAFSDDERRLLDRVNQKVAGAQTLDEVMTFLFESTRSICPSDRLSLHFLDEDGVRMVAYWVRALYEPVRLKAGYVQNLRGSSLKSIIEQGWLRIINNLSRYLADHPGSEATRLLVEEGNASSLTCPLRVDERIVGILFRSSRRPDAFDMHQVALHGAISERLGQAIEKAYRIEQLAKANRAYMELLGFVTHELKTPLASILMDANLLSKGYLGELSPQQLDRIQRIERRGDHLMNLIREYLDLARLEGGELHLSLLRDVDIVGEVVDQALEVAGPLLREREMTLVQDLPPGDVRADCDPALLRVVLVNLLNNAAKYGARRGEIRLTIRTDEESLAMAVRNTGQGFRPEERMNLFRKFVRLADPKLGRVQGTGIGLYTAWRIVCLHGGRIEARSEYGQWAEFELVLPRHGPDAESDGTECAPSGDRDESGK